MFRQADPSIKRNPALREAHLPCPLPDAIHPRQIACQTIRPTPLSRGRWLQLFDPKHTEWNCATLPIASLPAGLHPLRILHLSDLHLRHTWRKGYDHLLQRIAERKCDLILITGDFVDDKHDHAPALPILRRFLAHLHAPMGIYGVTGNHDGPDLLPRLADMNVTALDGQRTVVHHNGAAVELIGLPGPYRASLTQAFLDTIPPRRPDVPRIVLSHYPDHVLKIAHLNVDLMLAGHTHGGQCCLPGRIPLIRHDRLPRPLCHGLHRIQHTWLSISRGLGFSGVPLRVFCPTEAIELELQAG